MPRSVLLQGGAFQLLLKDIYTMTAQKAIGIFMNIAFAIVIWFAVPIVLPLAAALGWTLIVLNALFSLGIVISIVEAYATTPQE